jgi:hypothetical protein
VRAERVEVDARAAQQVGETRDSTACGYSGATPGFPASRVKRAPRRRRRE